MTVNPDSLASVLRDPICKLCDCGQVTNLSGTPFPFLSKGNDNGVFLGFLRGLKEVLYSTASTVPGT